MDTRKLKLDHSAAPAHTIKEATFFDDATGSRLQIGDAAELVKRWNAYPDLIEAMENLLRYCVTTKGLPDAGKGRTEDQQSALDAARAAIVKTEQK